MSKYFPVILGIVLCAALGVACSNNSQTGGVTIEPISGRSPTAVPSATLPTLLPTPRIIATVVGYEESRDHEPCKRGSPNYDYLLVVGDYVNPAYRIKCSGSTGDITVVILSTGSIAGYRKVKEGLVDVEVCNLLPKERWMWTFVTGTDLEKSVTPIDQQRVADGRLICS